MADVLRRKPIPAEEAEPERGSERRGDALLRYREPDRPRSFRCPGMPVTPIVGVGFSIWLITFLDPVTWLRFAVWFVLGMIVYFTYGYRRSALA